MKDKMVKVKRDNVEYCQRCGWVDWFNKICTHCGTDKTYRLEKASVVRMRKLISKLEK